MWNAAYKKITEIKNSAENYRVSTVAGAWVFYFLLAVVPFAFLIISAFNLFNVDFAGAFAARLPEEFKTAAFAIFDTAEKVSGGLTIFFAFTVLTSTFALINQMIKDGEFIYGVKRKTKNRIISAFFVLAFIIMLFFVFLFAAAVFAVAAYIFFPHGAARAGKVSKLLVFSTFLVFSCYIILVLLNRFICPVKTPFIFVLLGSFVSLFIIVSGTIGFILYVRFFGTYNAFYGSLATIVIFLLWAYIFMLGICLGSVIISKMLKKERLKI